MKTLAHCAFSLLLLMMAAEAGLAQPPAKASLRLQLVQTARSNGQVKDWFFAPSKTDSKMQGFAVQEQEIVRYDGDQTTTMPSPPGNLSTVFSRSGDYLGTSQIKTASATPDEKLFEVRIWTTAFEELYTLTLPYFFDDALPVTALLVNGAALLGQSSSGRLWFFDDAGHIRREVLLFPEASFDLERVLLLSVSHDGSRIVLAATKRGASPSDADSPIVSGEPHLFLFDEQGNQIWDRVLPLDTVRGLALSPDGMVVAASTYSTDLAGRVQKTSVLMDADGTVLSTYDFLFKQAHFSQDSRFVIMANNQLAQAVDVAAEQILWTQSIARAEGMITGIEISNDGAYSSLLVASNEFEDGRFVYRNLALKVIDQSGNLLQEVLIGSSSSSLPRLFASPSFDQIVVAHSEGYQLFEVVR